MPFMAASFTERSLAANPDLRISRALFWASGPEEAAVLSRDLGLLGFKSFATESQSVFGVFTDDIETLARILADRLSPEQRRQVKALVLDDRAPTLEDFANLQTVETFVQHHSSRWLARLLEEGRYKSLMQPIIAAETGEVHGYEFLFRGLGKDGAVIPPMDMFDAARDPALAALLDGKARDCAVRTAARLGILERLFINVQPKNVSVAASCFADTLDLIEAANIDPDRVVFEIVESEAVEDISHLSGLVDFCRSAGYRIALDDFGSGFNNLSMMIGLAPDYIKLDKSLISRICGDPQIWNLVANMIDAARQSGVAVIAEGVEDERTASLLRTIGADYMQGYLFGHPSDKPLSARA
ncbi:MAG: hypothetical protein Kow00104_12190 [Rhodothalassiaceae bacterium]